MTTVEKLQNYVEILIANIEDTSTATDEDVQALIDIIEASGIITDSELISI